MTNEKKFTLYHLFIYVGIPSAIIGLVSYVKMATSIYNDFFKFFMVLAIISTIIFFATIFLLVIPYIINNSKAPYTKNNKYTKIKQKVRLAMDKRAEIINKDERFDKHQSFIHNVRESLFISSTGYFAIFCDATKDTMKIIPHTHIKDIIYQKYDGAYVENELIITLKDSICPVVKFYCIHEGIAEDMANDLMFLRQKFISQDLLRTNTAKPA